MKKIWILGGGKFGRLALESVRSNLPKVEITMIDSRQIETETMGVTHLCEDGIDWLVENLKRDGVVDMIIPAIPIHMVAEWLKKKRSGVHTIAPASFPDHFLTGLPNLVQNGKSQVYVSHADFLCPDNCGEPELLCSYTGEARGEDMFRLLENLHDADCKPLVIRSYQLFPGVGGIYPGDMWSLLDNAHRSLDKTLLISTACRCHGVVDCLQFVASDEEPGL